MSIHNRLNNLEKQTNGTSSKHGWDKLQELNEMINGRGILPKPTLDKNIPYEDNLKRIIPAPGEL